MEKVSYFGLLEPRILLRVVKGSDGIRGSIASPSSPRWRAGENMLGNVDLGDVTDVYEISQKEAMFILDRWSRHGLPTASSAPATARSVVECIMVAVGQFVSSMDTTIDLSEPGEDPSSETTPLEPPAKLDRRDVLNLFKDLDVSQPSSPPSIEVMVVPREERIERGIELSAPRVLASSAEVK